MTPRQKFLKAIYPVYTLYKRLVGKGTTILFNKNRINPPQSFYDLSVQLNNGAKFNFEQLRGKKVLLVNTASNCGYTAQYEGLEKLYQQNADMLVVIGFPANDFKGQEKGTDEEIARFCKINFRITFPLAAKGSVVKGINQHSVFQWLTDRTKNGWNLKQPSWNFSKYLVNEKGSLVNFFGPAISPLGEDIKKAVARKISST